MHYLIKIIGSVHELQLVINVMVSLQICLDFEGLDDLSDITMSANIIKNLLT